MYYYVYIIESGRDNSYYVGCTNNIERRINEHNLGQSKYTKRKKPWILKYKERYRSLREARKRERNIKSWKKRILIEKLINHGAFV